MNSLSKFAGWMRENTSPEAAVNALWRLLPPNVRKTYATVPNAIAEMSPGAAVRDVVNESGNLSRSFMSADPMGMLNAASGMGLAAFGVVPGGRAGKVMKEAAPDGIRAFHGSPHNFDRFDMSKIGTGEGAQAYGHGLYFAENEGVAKQYRDQLRWRGADWNSPEVIAQNALDRFGGDKAEAILRLQGAVNSQARFSPKAVDQTTVQAIELLKSGAPLNAAPPTLGSMYEVRIKADRDKFLDWDKPLKEQPGIVRDALPSLVGAAPQPVRGPALRNRQAIANLDDSVPGDVIYNNLGGWRDPAGMSQRLRDSGIPGIKYLDGGSRGVGAGTSNFVVFDDKIIEIMRKYGWIPAGAIAGGMMMTPPPAEAAQ